jgi:hypothetical protein
MQNFETLSMAHICLTKYIAVVAQDTKITQPSTTL